MKAIDVISRQVDQIKPADPVRNAVGIMFSGSTNVIPVCLGKKLVGTISEADILSYLSSSKKQAKSIMTTPVNKIMNKRPSTVSENDSVFKVFSIMQEEDLEKMPVVDEEKRFLGFVSKDNVLRELIDKDMLFPETSSKFDFYSSIAKEIDWKQRLQNEIPDLARIFRSNNVKKVLDIGSGIGEHAMELSKDEFDVIAVERDSDLYNLAVKKKSKQKNLKGGLKYVNAEIDDYLLNLNNSFDAIIFMGNTISYNPETYRIIIKKASELLNKNGIVIFQIANFGKAIETNRRLINFDTVTPKENKKRNYAFLEFLDEPFRGRLITKNTIALLSENQKWQWAGLTSVTMAYFDEERMKRLLENEGFDKIETYGGNFDGREWDHLFRKPFRPSDSDWLNIIAVKK